MREVSLGPGGLWFDADKAQYKDPKRGTLSGQNERMWKTHKETYILQTWPLDSPSVRNLGTEAGSVFTVEGLGNEKWGWIWEMQQNYGSVPRNDATRDDLRRLELEL